MSVVALFVVYALFAVGLNVVGASVSTPTAWELGALPQYKEREEMSRVMRFLLPAAAVAMTGAAYGGVLASRLLS